MCRLSVVIPVYNVEGYIDRCLASLEGQTMGDFEAICINDGSTDGSLAKLEEWAARDPRIRVISQENAGPSVARNRGIREARGTYLAFLDSDDRLYRDACTEIVGMLESSGADVLNFGATIIPDSAATPWLYWALNPRNVSYDHFSMDIILRESSRPFVWKMAFRTSFLRDNELYFDEELVLGEDQAFCFSVYPRAQKVRFSSKKLYEYRAAREGSIMASRNADLHAKMLEHIQVADHILAEWSEELGILKQHAPEMLSWTLDFVMNDMMAAPQEDFKDVSEQLSLVLRRYFTLDDVHAVASDADRMFLDDLYRRSATNLSRRKWHAREFYDDRCEDKSDLRKWLFTSWYPGKDEAGK